MGLADLFFKSPQARYKDTDKAINEYSQMLGSMMALMQSNFPTINPDGHDYDREVFRSIGAVYETTDLICKKVIACPFVFYKVKDAKKLQRSKNLVKTDPVQAHVLKMQAIEEVDNESLLKLLNNPNPYQTGTQLVWTTALSYLLAGNTWVHANKVGTKAKELYCFPNMQIIGDTEDLLDPIRGYILQNTNQTPFDKDEIYHLKTGNPAAIDRTLEYLYGVSPLRAYLEPIRTIKEAKTQSSKQAKNGGVFGILSPQNKEDQFTDEQKLQMKEKMQQARRSNDELARVFPSTVALHWQSIGLPIGDLKLLELVSASEVDIYRAYHVPQQYHNQVASTKDNQSSAVKQLIYDAVAPLCEALGEAFTRFVGPGYDNVIIELDYTQLPEMAVNMKEVADYLKPLVEAGIITPDEARVALKYGETGLDFMKDHYVANGRVRLADVYEGKINANNNDTTTI